MKRRLVIAGATLVGLPALAALVLAVAVLAVPYPIARLSPDAGGPLVVTDRHGTVLRTIPDPSGRPGRARWIPLGDVPSPAVLALLAAEDADFFAHPGVDVRALARAAWLDVRAGRAAFGGSTLTMQLVRMVDSAGRPRTAWNKLREAVLALRLERALDKRAILEQYLNRAYYGNGAYGLEAAAKTYFGKPARALSVAEATLLAVVPRAPGRYDPLVHLDATLARRAYVFALMVQRGLADPAELTRADAQELHPTMHAAPFVAPHFVDWVVASLPPDVRARGGTLTTTLDSRLQEILERRVADHVAEHAAAGMAQAGMVVLDTRSAEVLAMVGSAGFAADEDGQVNITTWRRHPGSALKPFVYALALQAGDTPASVAYDTTDVPSAYRLRHSERPERGPVSYREALAGSYNLAAVHVLEKVGVEKLVEKLRQAGLGLPGGPADYGLRLALGSAKVRLLDLAAAYGFLVRGGLGRPANGVVESLAASGVAWRPARPREERLFSPEVSWLVMDMLSDPQARRPGFGDELPLDLPFRVAAKTGTARGFSDMVAVGVTSELTVAAWAGTFDGEPTEKLIGMRAAAPLVRDGLLIAGGGALLSLPAPPDGIVTADVCPLSGMRPGPDCPHRRLEHFVRGTVPEDACDWHRRDGGRVAVSYPPELQRWAQKAATRGGRGSQ